MSVHHLLVCITVYAGHIFVATQATEVNFAEDREDGCALCGNATVDFTSIVSIYHRPFSDFDHLVTSQPILEGQILVLGFIETEFFLESISETSINPPADIPLPGAAILFAGGIFIGLSH